MIYSAFGLPVTRIISGDIKNNIVTLEIYSSQGGLETLERTVTELRADNGINEIHDAINNPSSYQPDMEAVEAHFNQYCK